MKTVRILILTISCFTLLSSVYANNWKPYVSIGRTSIGEEPELSLTGTVGIQSPSGVFNFDVQILQTELNKSLYMLNKYDRQYYNGVSSFLPGIFLNPLARKNLSFEFGPVVRLGLPKIKRQRYISSEGTRREVTGQTFLEPHVHLGIKGVVNLTNHLHLTTEFNWGRSLISYDEIEGRHSIYYLSTFSSGLQVRF